MFGHTATNWRFFNWKQPQLVRNGSRMNLEILISFSWFSVLLSCNVITCWITIKPKLLSLLPLRLQKYRLSCSVVNQLELAKSVSARTFSILFSKSVSNIFGSLKHCSVRAPGSYKKKSSEHIKRIVVTIRNYLLFGRFLVKPLLPLLLVSAHLMVWNNTIQECNIIVAMQTVVRYLCLYRCN